ncbi:hypothetical protein DPMN_185020 [Dreissena polymorpha]|uniref:Uncharacterized protein n=1 Tax=Dreissena polymorpha TaxID=45954 RepID=A0A9D4DJM4_DREPO|nr:hypothetical protein DPMN_185020 [Dreissena polymorpha]
MIRNDTVRCIITDCANNPLGISKSLNHVKDAQLSGYSMYSSYAATGVRIDGEGAWYGIDATSYFQVAFGKFRTIEFDHLPLR